MKEYSYSECRQNLKTAISEVTENHEVVRVTNRRGRPVVIIDEQDYNSLLETAYLLRSPKNAERLLAAKHRSEKGDISFTDALTQLDL